MDITRTSGKRVSDGHPKPVNAESNQATVGKLWKALPALVFGVVLSIPGLAQAQYTFTTIDFPGAPGANLSTAANGNSTHEIVGEFGDEPFMPVHGFVLNKGVFTQVDVPGGQATSVNGINASGQLQGTYIDSGGTFRAFVANKGVFTTLIPPGSSRSIGGFINAQGQVVGTYRDSNQKRIGFIWSKGTFTTFNVLGDDPVLGTVAIGINDPGQVVGNYVPAGNDTNHRRAFLRSSKGEITTFDAPGAVSTIAQGINNAGTIVGLYVDAAGDEHGFVLSKGVFTTVDAPDASGVTEIHSINAKGEIVGVYVDAAGVGHGFLGTPVR